MYKRYTLSEIQKEVIKLLKDNNPMSSTEIAKKLGTNRITISKYLDILYFQKIINKKKIGSVNFWFIDPGIINIDVKDESYTDLEQKILFSLLKDEIDTVENIILSTINKKINLKKTILDIFFPIIKTLFELHKRGRIGKTEKIHLMTNFTNSINLIKNSTTMDDNVSKKDPWLIIVSGDDDSIPICNLINIFAKKIKINTSLIGNVEKYIDPFFDIDFQKYIKKLSYTTKEKTYVCLVSFNEISLKFLYMALNEIEEKEKIMTIIFSDDITKEKTSGKLKENIISDFGKLIETIEKEIK